MTYLTKPAISNLLQVEEIAAAQVRWLKELDWRTEKISVDV